MKMSLSFDFIKSFALDVRKGSVFQEGDAGESASDEHCQSAGQGGASAAQKGGNHSGEDHEGQGGAYTCRTGLSLVLQYLCHKGTVSR